MRKIKLVIVFVWVAVFSQAQNIDSAFISLKMNQASFEEFAKAIEQQTKLDVVFQSSWVQDLKVTIDVNHEEIMNVFSKVLYKSDLSANKWKNKIVLLKGEKLIAKLPDYHKEPPQEVEELEKPVENAPAFMVGRKADLLKIKIGSAKYPTIGRKVKVSGNIKEAGTSIPIENATLYIAQLRKGAVSDQEGNIQIDLPSGKYDTKIECLGMQEVLCQLEVVSNGDFSLQMQKANYDMKEVVIYGDRQMNIRDKDPGLEKMSVKSIKKLPNMMGESDIIKVSEMLPGVVSVGEGAAGLNVRGGSFDQNAFYFNKVPIYNTSHMFGFFPAFNADVINDFSIYKGYIPAQYGGRLSSIFDINARPGNKKNYTAHGGISPFAGNLTLEGPIKKDTASFLVSARSSYSDWILSRIDDYKIRNSKASFADFTASVNYDLPNTQVNIFAYHSQDYFKLYDINTYWYSNTGASTTVGHNFSSKLRGDFSLSGVQYQFKTIDQQMESAAYEHEFKVGHYELKADFQRVFSEKHSLDFGVNGVWYELNRGDVIPFGEASNQKPLSLGNEQGLETAIYLLDNYDITPLLNLNAGFRYSIYAPFGPAKVYTYYEDGPMDLRTIKDSISFASGEAIKWFHFPEFRFSLNYQTDEYGTVKLAFNQMHQNIFMLNNTITVAPNSQWKLADYHLEPSRAYQFSLGVFRNIPKGGWETSLEVYYKSTNNYTEFKDGADFLSTPLVETTVLQGDQKSYGIEFLLKRTGQRVDGWLAYTYSRSLVKVDGGESWNQINNGNVYPSNFDIPHVVNAIINYHISKRVTFSTTLTFQSGKPSTFPTSYYYIDGQAYLDYSKRNEYRIPNYFRTDVSLTIEGNLRKKKLLHSSFVFSIYNLTARENPYSVYFTKENGAIKSYQYSVIGVPILTATWIFKLGNYDAN
ncbi:MAG: TonB-dependent receptor plug domain-containing protein [Bacteroidales bacterium]|nr:TonB-dependent receptor plug domain-containing protein [Bacteroidales bacterium]